MNVNLRILILFLTTLFFISTSGYARPPLEGSKLKYLSSWKKLPSIEGQSLQTGKMINFSPERGTAKIVIFLASWCLKCQKLIPEMKKLEEKYRNKHAEFLFVFTHDTESDALGFLQGYKIDTQSILGNKKILNDFHQPPLPSIYISDRYEWLGYRQLGLDEAGLAKVNVYLEAHTRL